MFLDIGDDNVIVNVFSGRQGFCLPDTNGDHIRKTLENYPPVTTQDFHNNAKIVVDIGANTGLTSGYLSLIYKNATVHSFEPDPQTYQFLEINSANHRYIPYNLAISDTNGEAKLYKGISGSEETSLVPSKMVHQETFEIIKTAKLDSILDLSTIDVLKMDTEGYEVIILKSIMPEAKPGVIYLEYHSEADRIWISNFLQHNYILIWAKTEQPFRGNEIFMRKDLFTERETCIEIAHAQEK